MGLSLVQRQQPSRSHEWPFPSIPDVPTTLEGGILSLALLEETEAQKRRCCTGSQGTSRDSLLDWSTWRPQGARGTPSCWGGTGRLHSPAGSTVPSCAEQKSRGFPGFPWAQHIPHGREEQKSRGVRGLLGQTSVLAPGQATSPLTSGVGAGAQGRRARGLRRPLARPVLLTPHLARDSLCSAPLLRRGPGPVSAPQGPRL